MRIWAGVYDSLSARLAEAAGFDGLWLSSYGLSASRLGLPDEGHLTPALVLQACQEVVSRSRLPVTVDIENGYGLAIGDLARAAAALAAAGARLVCIEDTIGPKKCSLWEHTDRELRGVDEMAALLAELCARLGGGRGVIGRTEALLEGGTVDEVLERVRAYSAAGCWGVVVHFRDPRDLERLFRVARRCAGEVRLVVIPTAAPDVEATQFARHGFSVYVAAHVGIRSAAQALARSFSRVLDHGRLREALEGAMSMNDLDTAVGRRLEVIGA